MISFIQSLLARIGLCLATLLLSGCLSTERLGTQSSHYNQALESSVNVNALTNVVRASQRLPMVYSRMGSMTYTGSISAKPGATVTLGNNTAEDAPISLELKVEDGGTTNFEALLGVEFYQAILNSISPHTVALYRTQGWPDSVLFPLFIERIEFSENQKNNVVGEKLTSIVEGKI